MNSFIKQWIDSIKTIGNSIIRVSREGTTNIIRGVSNAIDDFDAVNKGQLDSISSGLNIDIDSSTYVIPEGDSVLNLLVSYTATGAVSIDLPDISTTGVLVIHVKDSGCNSSINPITLNATGVGDTITDYQTGQATTVLNDDGMGVKLIKDVSNQIWEVIL